jgi:MoaA/NifB/PqqE/SkfB family radical SAM enzyme
MSTFPIRNSAACVYKWAWNTFRLYNGTSSSCHRVKTVPVSIENFEHFHNTPEVINDRKLMLEGKWPGRGCEYCQSVEQQGGISDRLYQNQIAGLTPDDFSLDYSVSVTPKISEIYLTNTCDLACVYCFPGYSSKINYELKKFGPYPIGIESVTELSNRDQYFSAYMTWLDQNYQHLNRLSIMGGEPLLQKEMWDILDFVSTRVNHNIEIAINTNLNATPETLEKFIDICKELLVSKKIKRLDICCSLDCWGPQIEFIRYGLSLDRWQQNFEYLIKHKWLAVSVHHVVTALSIATTKQLQDIIKEYKKINPKIMQEYHLVDSGYEEIYHPTMFGSEFFKIKLEQLLEEFPLTTEWDNQARLRLEGICKLMSAAQPDPLRLTKLHATLDITDQRRGTNWKLLFPEINEYFKINRISNVVQ